MRVTQLLLVVLVFASSLLIGCSSGGGTSNNNQGFADLKLGMDQMSPIPLVNGIPQTFYIYVTNYGKSSISGLSFSAEIKSAGLTSNSASQNLLSKINNLVFTSQVKSMDADNPIKIIDSSECTTLSHGQSCRILLRATAPGVAIISANIMNRLGTLPIAQTLVQVNNYVPNINNSLADTLTFSPISPMSFGGSGGSYNFYVINNGNSPVILTEKSFGNLPNNATLMFGYCPNPLPSAHICQIRLVLNNAGEGFDQTLNIPLHLNAAIINSDGKITLLPPQNLDNNLTATNDKVGVIQTILNQHLIVNANSGTTPVAGLGVIRNIGTGTMTISSVVPTDSGLLTISNDNCSGKVLKPNEFCSYTPHLSVGSINGGGATTITITYMTTASSISASTSSTINWSYIPSTPIPGQRVVVPNLKIQANSLFYQTITQAEGTTSTPYLITLTNSSTAQRGADATLTIPYTSLLPTDDSFATYSINTSGIGSKPCNLPSSGNNMTLLKNASCSYYLIITTANKNNDMPASAKFMDTKYSYNTYTAGSITPIAAQATALRNGFTLALGGYRSQLTVSVSNPAQVNNFNAVEQGAANPTISLIIHNTGNIAVNGIITGVNLPNGITINTSSCTNLASQASCIAVLTMSTVNLIGPGNLDTSNIRYNNGAVETTASIPSISYSVVPPASPTITMKASLLNCVAGNGITSACMNNPDNMGGTASTIQVILTFTNTSNAAATTLTLPTASSSFFTEASYTAGPNNCGNGIPANGGTCTIAYNIPTLASSKAYQSILNVPNFVYNYTYGSIGQISASSASHLFTYIDIVEPYLTIGNIPDITAGNSSGTINLGWSSLYQATVPTTSVIATASDGVSPVNGLTPNPATTAICTNSIINYSTSCTTNIGTTTATPGANSYKFKASAFDGIIEATPVSFNVIYNFYYPSGIILNPQGTIAFITNQNNTVSQCQIIAGALSNCSNSGGTGFSNPTDIVLNSAGTIAFITNGDSNTVSSCTVTGGALSNCADTGATSLYIPLSIALNSAGTIAFITNGNNTISQCTVNGSNLSACSDTGVTSLNYPAEFILNSANTIAFIPNFFSNSVMQCSVSNNVLSSCADSGGSGFNSPLGMALNPAGTYAFITNFYNNEVIQCTVNGGMLSGCSNSGGTGFNGPAGTVFDAIDSTLFVVNYNNSTVSYCKFNGSTLGACSISN